MYFPYLICIFLLALSYFKKNNSASTPVDLIISSWLSNTCEKDSISLAKNIVIKVELFILIPTLTLFILFIFWYCPVNYLLKRLEAQLIFLQIILLADKRNLSFQEVVQEAICLYVL